MSIFRTIAEHCIIQLQQEITYWDNYLYVYIIIISLYKVTSSLVLRHVACHLINKIHYLIVFVNAKWPSLPTAVLCACWNRPANVLITILVKCAYVTAAVAADVKMAYSLTVWVDLLVIRSLGRVRSGHLRQQLTQLP